MTLVFLAAALVIWLIVGVAVSLAVGGAFNAKDHVGEDFQLPRPRASAETDSIEPAAEAEHTLRS